MHLKEEPDVFNWTMWAVHVLVGDELEQKHDCDTGDRRCYRWPIAGRWVELRGGDAVDCMMHQLIQSPIIARSTSHRPSNWVAVLALRSAHDQSIEAIGECWHGKD